MIARAKAGAMAAKGGCDLIAVSCSGGSGQPQTAEASAYLARFYPPRIGRSPPRGNSHFRKLADLPKYWMCLTLIPCALEELSHPQICSKMGQANNGTVRGGVCDEPQRQDVADFRAGAGRSDWAALRRCGQHLPQHE